MLIAPPPKHFSKVQSMNSKTPTRDDWGLITLLPVFWPLYVILVFMILIDFMFETQWMIEFSLSNEMSEKIQSLIINEVLISLSLLIRIRSFFTLLETSVLTNDVLTILTLLSSPIPALVNGWKVNTLYFIGSLIVQFSINRKMPFCMLIKLDEGKTLFDSKLQLMNDKEDASLDHPKTPAAESNPLLVPSPFWLNVQPRNTIFNETDSSSFAKKPIPHPSKLFEYLLFMKLEFKMKILLETLFVLNAMTLFM